MAELTRRYVVMAMASEMPFDSNDPDGVFVLKPWKDPAALRALQAYRDNCYPELARDLDGWIAAIAAGAAIRGDVGRRNEPHLRTVASSPGAGARTPSRRRQASRKTRATARRTAGKSKRKKRTR